MKVKKTISAADLAALKGVSRQTVYNNKALFEWEGKRIVWNSKAKNWEPDNRGRIIKEANQ